MPITTTCPGCNSLFQLQDDLAGERVRCEKCAYVFEVPKSPVTGPEPVAVETTPAADTPATEEVVLATVADPPKPPPLPSESPVSMGWTLSMLLLYVLSLLGAVALAALWIATHLGPPVPVSASTLPIADLAKAKPAPAAPHDLVLGPDGGLSVNNQGLGIAAGIDHGKWKQDGPYHLFRVKLQEGTTYNFHVRGHAGVKPRLRIIDDPVLPPVADRAMQHDRVMLAYKPKRPGAHLLWITCQAPMFGPFDLSIARETPTKPIAVDLPRENGYTDSQVLLLQDSLDPAQPRCGTYRDYEVKLEGKKDYIISVTAFLPVLRVADGLPIHGQGVGPAQVASTTFRPPQDGKYRVRVTTDFHILGRYTLKIIPRVRTVHTILAPLDEDGEYQDQRALTVGDPVIANQGACKDYLLTLEKGKKYRVAMSLGNAPTSVTVFDPGDNPIASEAGKQNATVTLTANQTGMHRIRVAAPLPPGRAKYTLRITTVP